MTFIIAAALIVLTVGVVYGLRRKWKPPGPAAFVCRRCNERHCQCERQS